MLQELLGVWSLDRRILDRRLGRSGCVHGQLAITPADGGADWAESGTLRWSGHETPVSRRLLLRRYGGTWWMLFAGGRPFHPWRPGEQVVHECGADIYRGLVTPITRRAGDRMRIEWTVTGPQKHQVLTTRLRRVGAVTPAWRPG